ncbi:MAG TPA: signal peptide peptidase SppA [Polyangiaceae bacterium]|nr:signal peptide peptidase SppA [Polyangiaceae bacterium]
MKNYLFSSLGLAALLSLGASLAKAAPIPVEPERLPALGRSVAGTDDTTALVLNPANLAYQTSWELRWEAIYLHGAQTAPWSGHAITAGMKLPFSFATAIRLDVLSPPQGAFGGLSQNYEWLTWGLAYQASESLAFGFSLQRAYSNGPVAGSLGSYTLGVSARPSTLLGLSLVASNVNGPLDGAAARRVQALGAVDTSLGASITAAVAVRPFGTRAVELGLEGRYMTEPHVWQPRATLGIDLPPVGRLRGEFAVLDPEESSPAWRATASLEVDLNGTGGSSTLEGGMLTGTELGQSGSYSFYNNVAIRGFREPVGIQPPHLALRIRLESTPDTREHVALLRKLWSISTESDVDAVVFEIRSSPADSLAHIQELRDAFALLRSRGKRILCHLEDASGGAIYLCSAANRTLLNPAGGIRFAGLKTRHIYLANLLDKVGVRADFIRIGAHKSAPEQFTRSSASDVARADSIDLLQQSERWFAGDVAHDRGMTVESLRDKIAHGPFVATEAKQAGLVDALAFDDQIEQATRDLVGGPVTTVDADRAEVAPTHFGSRRSVALVYVDGDIIDGRSRKIPLLGIDLAGSYTIADTLKRVRESPLVSSVVLRIESPGGSSMASDVMWREVLLTARVKPVIVSMGEVAASGGYYIAAPATRILANPLTITGSIGIFYGKADVTELLRKIGVNVEVYKTAPRADAESLFRPFTEEEHTELGNKVAEFYDVFLSRVAEGRKMTKEAVDRIGQGRVWTGEQAKANGLVDELGGLRQALYEARKLGDLPEDAPIIELPKIQTSLLGTLLGIEGLHAETDALPAVLPPAVMQLAHAMAPLLVHPADRPLARLEITKVEP